MKSHEMRKIVESTYDPEVIKIASPLGAWFFESVLWISKLNKLLNHPQVKDIGIEAYSPSPGSVAFKVMVIFKEE